MKKITLGTMSVSVPAVAVGCMRMAEFSVREMANFIRAAIDMEANFFDHADIYGGGKSEEVFGRALENIGSSLRSQMIIQSKCGIRSGFYDLSREHIILSVEDSLRRLHTDHLDILLLHRPDALTEPDEIAAAFDKLESSGKVRFFGVSNHNPMQIQLLKKYVRQNLVVNQLQFSLAAAGIVAQGLEVNMESDGATNRDGSVLDYCRLNDMTIQAWSPFQMPGWKGCFIGSAEYATLNERLELLGQKYNATPTQVAAAWIFRHPAQMQLVAGSTNPRRLLEITAASGIQMTREDWYSLYRAAGHILP